MHLRRVLCAATAAAALTSSAPGALAGGFEVREQSALFMGMSFAGAAAGGTALASMFWNPAAAAFVGDGISFDSSYSLVLPRADLTVETFNAGGGPIPAGLVGLDTTVDFGRDALVPASYMAYRINPKLVFALSMNSQYGLGTKPDNTDWVGQNVGRSSKLFTTNTAPTLAYEVMPGVHVGAGVQLQYFDLKRFKSAAGAPGLNTPSSVLEGNDWGLGYTLGVNLTPARGTSIGIGFRSSIEHDLEGTVKVVGGPPATQIRADVELPEKITASLRQDLTQGLRLHATAEWTNWSRLGVIPIVARVPGVVVANLDFQWEDGWFFALGGEYDVNDKLTVRAGGAYEISPIQDATARLVQLPDNDRIWASIGASYKAGNLFGILKDATIDLSYSHIFVEDGEFQRSPSAVAFGGFPEITGTVDAAVDIVAVGIRSKW